MNKFTLILILQVMLFSNDKFDSFFVGAGQQYGVPPLLLKNIAKIESNLNPNAICLNANGTKDYGLMQINTIHLKRLHNEYGITEQLIMEPKTNIYAGAQLLSKIIRQYGLNFEAIGRYHSNTQEFKSKWNNKLTQELLKSLKKSNSKI